MVKSFSLVASAQAGLTVKLLRGGERSNANNAIALLAASLAAALGVPPHDGDDSYLPHRTAAMCLDRAKRDPRN